MELKLNKKYDLGGIETDTINLDFDKLTGRALVKLENEYKKENKGVVLIVNDAGFNAKVAAYCAGVKEDDILDLAGKDFTAVTQEVMLFLN